MFSFLHLQFDPGGACSQGCCNLLLKDPKNKHYHLEYAQPLGTSLIFTFKFISSHSNASLMRMQPWTLLKGLQKMHWCTNFLQVFRGAAIDQWYRVGFPWRRSWVHSLMSALCKPWKAAASYHRQCWTSGSQFPMVGLNQKNRRKTYLKSILIELVLGMGSLTCRSLHFCHWWLKWKHKVTWISLPDSHFSFPWQF